MADLQDIDFSELDNPAVQAAEKATEKLDEVKLEEPEKQAKKANEMFSDADFMAALDRQVNGGIYDNEEPKQQTQKQEPPVAEDNTKAKEGLEETKAIATDKVAELERKLEKIEKRYGDSSEEAIRLRSEIDKYQPYIPLLDAIKEDPKLFGMVNDYYEKGGQAPANILEELGLSEDFVFDGSELRDPNSDSSKLLSASIQKAVNTQVQSAISAKEKANAEAARKAAMKNEKEKFIEKHGVEAYENTIKYMKENELSLEAVHKLMNLPERDKQVAQSAVEEQVSKAQSTRQKAPSLAGDGGGQAKEPDIEDIIWAGIERAVGGSNIFGNLETK